MLSVGDKAPAFTLPDQDGNPVSLGDFAGSKVVVYFYPRDNTPGCTRQACAFRDSYQVYRERNIAVIGISKDSVKSHRGFADKQNLPFILLSDPEHKVIEAFGAWQEKKQYGKRLSAAPLCWTKPGQSPTCSPKQNRTPTPRKSSPLWGKTLRYALKVIVIKTQAYGKFRGLSYSSDNQIYWRGIMRSFPFIVTRLS